MIRALTSCLCLCVGLVAVPAAQRRPASDIEVKAAYLYNFTRFTVWPPRQAAAAPLAICVLGSDPFGGVLDATLKGVTVQGAAVVPRRVADARDAPACHVLFISASEERRLDAILAALGHADVLTVSDMPQFAARGGMIQFVNQGGRVRFEIALAPAHDAGLSLSSELLRVAAAVRREREGA